MTAKIIKSLGIIAALGVSAMPLASYAAESDTANATVNVTVAETISITVDQEANAVELQAGKSDTSSIKHVVKVSTNAKNGYILDVKDEDTDTSLKLAGTSFSIPTSTTAPADGGKTWGVKTGSTWSAMPASNAAGITLKTADALAGSTVYTDDATDVIYGVAVDNTLASGTYTDTVVYTATTR